VPLLAEEADVLLLVKPQFEAERGEVGRGGIVRDEAVRARAAARVAAAAVALGLESRGVVASPITGAEGNVELLAAFRRNPATLRG
jgi:23S rRNA (cytidine1920-2'-O)/16S rRNA (cytidine1409-2'-O)-methyltransferase